MKTTLLLFATAPLWSEAPAVCEADRVPFLVQHITRWEGSEPGQPLWELRNPGGLVYVGQPGATRSAHRDKAFPLGLYYARFETREAGEQALTELVRANVDRPARMRRAWRYLK